MWNQRVALHARQVSGLVEILHAWNLHGHRVAVVAVRVRRVGAKTRIPGH